MKIPPVYKDYLDAIVRYYKQEKTTPDFSNRLLNPTSANLRDECLTVFLEGPAARDMKALKTFFEAQREDEIHRKIESIDIDKFKPLGKYLRGNLRTTADKNIELLGWLINFPYRPFDSKINYDELYREQSSITKPVIKHSKVVPVEATKAEGEKPGSKPLPVNDTDMTKATEGPQRLSHGFHAKEPKPALINKLGWLVAGMMIVLVLGYWGNYRVQFEQGKIAEPTSALIHPPQENNSHSDSNASPRQSNVLAAPSPKVELIMARCQAITKMGKQCKRSPANGLKFCWQHKKKVV